MESRNWKIEWSDQMSVGIPEIDADHQRFIALVNAFNLAVIERSALDVIKHALQLILDDAVEHFAHEEQLFKDWKYPDADEHANIHAQLTATLQGIVARLGSHSTEPEWIEAGLEIKEALINHILTEDMKYADFYHQSRAIQS